MISTSETGLKKQNHIQEIPPEIPKSDQSSSKKPPINLRIHNTKIITEKLPLANIVGLGFDQSLLDKEFRPNLNFNNKKFRKVWKWIHGTPKNGKSSHSEDDETFISRSITLAKINDQEYYVIEGIRRVSALKYSRFKYLETQVIDYSGIYQKILERKERVKRLKNKSTNQIKKINTFKPPKRLKYKPTPVKKIVRG